MSDDLEKLQQEPELLRLLEHYSAAAGEQRDLWIDRVMELADGSRGELARWHGELLASSFLEQNTGQTPQLAAGRVAQCYRVTGAGRSALRKLAS